MTTRKTRIGLMVILFLAATVATFAQGWRAATVKELSKALPARATVEKEKIETEMKSASGVKDTKGKLIAGVVLITAGYSAEGKYSHFLFTQVAIKIGDVTLQPGEYLIGQKRVEDGSIEVRLHEAASGKLRGTLQAKRGEMKGAIRSIQITTPKNNTGAIYLGRFTFAYSVVN